MDDNFNLTLSGFKNFKPMVFVKTKHVPPKHTLKFIQGVIAVPNSSFCIKGRPTIEKDNDKKKIKLVIKVKGALEYEGQEKVAGQLLYFSYKKDIGLEKDNEDEFELIVRVKGDIDRGGTIGKSVLKTIDEDD